MIFDHFPRPYNPSFVLDRERKYEAQRVHHKPRGFWVSVRGEMDWPTWCAQEEFFVESLAARYEVTVREDANLLILNNIPDILEFDAEYAADIVPGAGLRSNYIDWERVVSGNSYDGIIITPYQWPLRNSMKCFWYYSWDVASGCIWNLDVIEKITPAFDVPLPEHLGYEDEGEYLDEDEGFSYGFVKP